MKLILVSLMGLVPFGLAQTAGIGSDSNRARIEELRKLTAGNTLQQGDPAARDAQLKLAKLGQTRELQEIYCQLYSKYREDIVDAGEVKLPAVGGWFAIKSLDQLFDEDDRFNRAKVRTNDLSFPDAHQFGLVLLPKLVPNPPIETDDAVILEAAEQQQEKVKVWKQWISEHQSELEKIEPTGAGVEFSPTACKNGKPVANHR